MLSVLLLLLIAGICGGIAQALAGSRGGFLVSIALGFIGALLGKEMSRALALPELLAIQVGGSTFPVVWSIIGAALFVALLSIFTGRRYARA